MNKLQFILLSIPVFLLGITGCKTKSHTDTNLSKAEFSIDGNILSVTKAPQLDANGAGFFANGDKNSVFASSSSENVTDRFTYTYGQQFYWSDLGLTGTSDLLDITACYPPVETTSPADFEWNVMTCGPDKDFLFSAPVQVKRNSPEPVKLAFTHALHKLQVNVKTDGTTMTEDQLDGLRIVCRNFLPAARLNLLAGTASLASGDPAETVTENKEASFLIPAQKTEGIEIVILLDKRESVCRLSDCSIDGQALTFLESGKSFTLNITVSEKEFSITGQEISGWGDQGEINDSITI